MYKLLINSQRLSRRQIEQSDLQADVRTGALILPAELREIGYDGNGTDLLDISVATSIRFRAMRGVGLTCGITATQLYVVKPLLGDIERAPQLTDTLLVFIDGNKDVAADDQWVRRPIAAIDNSTCPSYPTQAAWRLTIGGVTDLSAYLAAPAKIFVGGPVRFYEQMDFGLYPSGGKSWLGAKAAAAANWEPVLGPLDSDSGVKFTYYNAADGVTADKNLVRNIRIDFNGRSDEPVWIGGTTSGPAIETLGLTARVALRNNTRP
jgi:hypothetical protein